MSHAHALTDATFHGEVEHSPGLTLVDCWAPWCARCLLLSPIVNCLAAAYADRVRVLKMNADENAATVARLGMRSIPTLPLFDDGHVVASLVGVVPQSRIEVLLDVHLALRAA